MHRSWCGGEAGSRAAQEGSARRALQAGLAAAAPGQLQGMQSSTII